MLFCFILLFGFMKNLSRGNFKNNHLFPSFSPLHYWQVLFCPTFAHTTLYFRYNYVMSLLILCYLSAISLLNSGVIAEA